MPTLWRVIYFIAVRGPIGLFPFWVLLIDFLTVGYCLRHPAEQKGALRFLGRVEKVLGWRTEWIKGELEQQWAELAQVDSRI